jgi:DNA repair ATPase RecN
VAGLFDFANDAARSVLKLLGGAEHEVEKHSPVEEPLHEAIAAIHRAADSLDKHVEVLEAVAATLPALTDALVKLTAELGEALHLAAPLEAAEREVAGIGHLFRRRHHAAEGAADTAEAAPEEPTGASAPSGDDG